MTPKETADLLNALTQVFWISFVLGLLAAPVIFAVLRDLLELSGWFYRKAKPRAVPN